MSKNPAESKGSSGVDRREFLRTGARAGAVGAGIVAGLSLNRSVHAQGSDIIRIGMIGCGSRCSGAAVQALSTGDDVRLVAMCDVFPERLEASLTNIRKVKPDQVAVDNDHKFTSFDGYRHVIEASDVVLIACASKFHPMYAEAAIQAGKHVFVEKPHGIDPVGVRRMAKVCELAKEKGLSIQSGLQSRYSLAWQETMKRIHDGIIGDIVATQSMFLRGPYRVYDRDPRLTEVQYHFYNWYHFCWLSGDDVPQSLVHNMDRMTWALQGETPKWCFSLAGRATSFGTKYGDMFDHHTVVYEYESGARVYAMCRTQNGTYGNSSDIIMGTKGVCYLGRSRIEGETNWQYSGPGNNPYQTEHDVLFDAIRKNEPINAGDYMAKSTMVTVLGQLAAYTGKPMTYAEVEQLDFEYKPSPEEASFEVDPPTLPGPDGNYPLPIPGVTNLDWLAGPRRPAG